MVPMRIFFSVGISIKGQIMTKSRKTPSEPLVKKGENFANKPLKDKIGGNLRQIYDDVVNEPVPDDFLALLAKADDDDS